MGDVQNLVDETLVQHTAFQQGEKRLEQCFRYAHGAAEPEGIPIIGESRTGKTRLIEELFAKHPPKRTAAGLIVPVLSVKTPAKPTVKGLVETLLKGIGDPKYSGGTEIAKTNRLKGLMQDCGTRMVVIDEFQHFYDKGSDRVIHQVADWLKILADDTRVAVAVAGLESCMAVLEQNEQLQGRFQSPVRMLRFKWTDRKQRGEFQGILRAFHESLTKYFDLPELHEETMAFRCYCATGGLFGYLNRFLRQAVHDAIDARRNIISLEALKEAHKTAVWSETEVAGDINPFERKFDPRPNEDLLAKVAQMGRAIDPPARRHGGGAARPYRPVSNILSRAGE